MICPYQEVIRKQFVSYKAACIKGKEIKKTARKRENISSWKYDFLHFVETTKPYPLSSSFWHNSTGRTLCIGGSYARSVEAFGLFCFTWKPEIIGRVEDFFSWKNWSEQGSQAKGLSSSRSSVADNGPDTILGEAAWFYEAIHISFGAMLPKWVISGSAAAPFCIIWT